MPPISTPMLDKARSEELTSSEIEDALHELGALNGGSLPSLEARYSGHFYEWRIKWGARCSGWRIDVETALVTEADELLRLIAEERAPS